MSSTLENQILDAFANLGSRSALANGFRLQAKGKQTVAVYFSGNEPGNSVEIGLNPIALAPLLGIEEGALRRWISDQAALTGRVRAMNGQRGTYPGAAFGNQKELVRFLDALAALRAQQPVPAPSASASKVRIEKAAQDAGFDLSASVEGEWSVFHSTAFPQALGIASLPDGGYRLGLPDAVVGRQIGAEFGIEVAEAAERWAILLAPVPDYQTLHEVISRVAAMCRVVAGAALKEFEQATRKRPDTTEAVRLVVQRVGQDIVRKSLLDYWGRRCSVSGLAVPQLLRASHIKPWADCDSDAERLDVFNGLLLAPHLDALFDGGWVTFSDAGEMLIVERLDAASRDRLNLSGTERIAGLTDRHCAYLTWHRAHRFGRMS